MTPQEESMLNDLIGRVQQTQLTEKDPEAEQLLNQSLGRNPNALYILAQTVLVQNYALEQAQAQLSELRQQTQALQQQPAHTTSFLGNLLGHRDPAPPPPPPQPGYGASPYGQPWNQCPRMDRLRRLHGGVRAFCAPPRRRRPAWLLEHSPFRGSNLYWVDLVIRPVSAEEVGCLAAARAGQRKPSSTTTTMTPAANMGASTIPAWAIAAAMPPTCNRPVTTSETMGANQDDLSLDDTSYDDSSFDDSSGGDDLA